MEYKKDFVTNREDPLLEFQSWFELAKSSDNFEPTAMTLSSVDSRGMPSSRMVLLKIFDYRGFCFFTNYQSFKAREITENPKACLCFHWQKPFHRQVRIQGFIEKMQTKESVDYFRTRLRSSQLGAWASPQSQRIGDRGELESGFKEMEKRFEGQDIPCPPFWGGFRLKPLSIEFWQSREFRLHDRMKFVRQTFESSWASQSFGSLRREGESGCFLFFLEMF